MGYHFKIDSFSFDETASAGDTLNFKLDIDNVGVAPFYKKAALKIRLVNDEKEYVFDTDVDIKNGSRENTKIIFLLLCQKIWLQANMILR